MAAIFNENAHIHKLFLLALYLFFGLKLFIQEANTYILTILCYFILTEREMCIEMSRNMTKFGRISTKNTKQGSEFFIKHIPENANANGLPHQLSRHY